MQLPTLGRSLTEREQVFIVDVIIGLNKARGKFPGNRNRLDALVEEVGEVATALMDNEGPERVRAECVDVAVTAMRLALEGDSAYPKARHSVQVGCLEMVNIGNDKVWIGEIGGGEGGEFPLIDVATLVHKYYAENF